MNNRTYRKLSLRYFWEKAFWSVGFLSLILCGVVLVVLIGSIAYKASGALWRSDIKLNIELSQTQHNKYTESDCKNLIKNSLLNIFEKTDNQILSLISIDSPRRLCNYLKTADPVKNFEFFVPANSNIDQYIKHGNSELLSNQVLDWTNILVKKNLLTKKLNFEFFTNKESREPEIAGILSSFVGSIFTVIVCILFAFPLSILTALCLEEYAPKNKFITFIEININNLAAVPSVVFGLLGLFLYITIADLPRSSSLVAGLTLGLMVIPTMIITSRVAIKAVPKSLKHAALALGASKVQTTFGFSLPLALPGIMTGAVLSISRILGETAPLIMIGMVAFIVDLPKDILEPATVLPVQIFLWADNPENGFVEKTSAAIMVLLLLLIFINSLAVYIRKKFDKRW